MIKKIQDINELQQIFSDEKNIFLYGAGKVSKMVLKYAAIKDASICKILVSSKIGNPSKLRGIQIEEYSTKTQLLEGTMIVCAMENLHQEILSNIAIDKVKQIYCATSILYNQLVYEMGDYDIEILDKIDDISKIINPQIELWNNCIEKKLTEENWGNYYDKKDFMIRYLRLIEGLDPESVDTIVRIINRHKIYLAAKKMPLDLYTQKEKQELHELKDNFTDLIIKLSDDLYMYKNYRLPSSELEASVLYYKHGIHKINDVNYVSNKNVIDVGGYIGDSALVLSELNPRQIIVFEPIMEHCQLISKTVELNKMKNVIVENVALGKETGTLELQLAGSGTSAYRKGISYTEIVEVPVMSLDSYVREKDIKEIGLIKVDIEGAEISFLEGARDTIERDKPILIISIYHNVEDFFEIKPMIESWNLGYKFSVYKPTNGNLTNETVLIAEIK